MWNLDSRRREVGTAGKRSASRKVEVEGGVVRVVEIEADGEQNDPDKEPVEEEDAGAAGWDWRWECDRSPR